jgi:hypothetical protein
MKEELSLVIGGPPGKDAPVSARGLERRRTPKIQRLSRLNVVVTVDKEGGCVVRGASPAPEGYRMAGRFEQLGLHPCFGQIIHDPLSSPPGVGSVFSLGANGRDAEKGIQLPMERRELCAKSAFKILSRVAHRASDRSFSLEGYQARM